jgi:predicted component of type VI protein secretion system
MMDIELLVTHVPSGASQQFTGQVADRLQLGRDSVSPIQFQGRNISRKHLDLLNRDGKVVVQDLSTNGTWVNGERAAKGAQHEVHNGDLIEIPEYRIEIRLPGEGPSAPSSAFVRSMPGEPPARSRCSKLVHRLTASLDPLEGLVVLGAIGSLTVILVYLSS